MANKVVTIVVDEDSSEHAAVIDLIRQIRGGSAFITIKNEKDVISRQQPVAAVNRPSSTRT